MRHLSAILLLLFIAKNDLLAQDESMHMHHGQAASSTHIFLLMMDTMMVRMENADRGRSAEADFLLKMIPHHEGAISMAMYEVVHGHNFEMIQLAKSILTEQQSEIGEMKMWLQNNRGDSLPGNSKYPKAMDQTMKVMMAHLPGNKDLNDVDHAFASVMIPHHQAAIDMAKVLLTYGKEQQTISFARLLIANEQIEIEQMSNYIQ